MTKKGTNLGSHRTKKLEQIVPSKSGFALVVDHNELLRITDIEGLQVMDFIAFNFDDTSEKFSQSRTRLDNNYSFKIGKGGKLFSNLGNIMFTIVEDTFRAHDLFFASCHRKLNETVFRYAPGGPTDPYDGCFEHLAASVEKWNLKLIDIPDPINFNMNTRIDTKIGKVVIELPKNKPGSYITLIANMKCIAALTSCADEITPCNGGRSTPIMIELFDNKDE